MRRLCRRTGMALGVAAVGALLASGVGGAASGPASHPSALAIQPIALASSSMAPGMVHRAAAAAYPRTVAVGPLPVALALDSRTRRGFIALYGNGAVRIFDTRTGEGLRSVALGHRPLALAVDERAGRVLVTTEGAPGGAGAVVVLAALTGQVLASAPVGVLPGAIAVDEGTQHAFVLNLDSNSVSMLDTRTGRSLRTTAVPLVPHGPSRYSPTCRGLDPYNICYGNDSAQRTIWLPSPPDSVSQRLRQSPQALAIDTRRGRLFVVDSLSNSVSVLATRTGALLRTLPVGTHPLAVAVDQETGRAFVANAESNSVSVFDPQGRAISSTLPVGRYPGALLLQRSPARLVVANIGDESVTLFDARTEAMLGRAVPLAYGVNALAADGRTGHVLIASLSTVHGDMATNPGSIAVVDSRAGTLLRTVPVGGLPVAVAVDERSRRAFILNLGGSRGASVNGLFPSSMTILDLAHLLPGQEAVLVGRRGATPLACTVTCQSRRT